MSPSNSCGSKSSKRPKGMDNPKMPMKTKKPSVVIAVGVGKPKKMADMKKKLK